MNCKIEPITRELAANLCQNISTDLPEYFGLEESNTKYINGVQSRHNFAVKEDDTYVALLSLDFPYPNNGNIYWMGVLRDHQGRGMGKKLIEHAIQFSSEKGATTLTVETLAPQHADMNYLKTYKFYESCGFHPLLNLKPERYKWEMVYMVKSIFMGGNNTKYGN